MNEHVTFEIAQLLKNAGFDVETKYYYEVDSMDLGFHIGYVGDVWKNSEIENGYPHSKRSHQIKMISAPTISDVIDWFESEHGIYIYTYPVEPYQFDDDNEYPKIVWVSKIISMKQVMFEKFIDEDNGLAINHHIDKKSAYISAFKFLLKK